jgi:hypothetical protein
MKPLGHQLLPRTGRTLDQHRAFKPRGTTDRIQQQHNAGVLSDEAMLRTLGLTIDQANRCAHLGGTFGRRGLVTLSASASLRMIRGVRNR